MSESLSAVDRSQRVNGTDEWRLIMAGRQQVVRSTYKIEVLNSRGRVLETKEVTRRSQEAAHRVARQVLWTKPIGTRMRMLREGVAVETLVRTKTGWDYEVLNGSTVRAADRDWTKTHPAKAKAGSGKARPNSKSKAA
jgi:hypothetical protein